MKAKRSNNIISFILTLLLTMEVIFGSISPIYANNLWEDSSDNRNNPNINNSLATNNRGNSIMDSYNNLPEELNLEGFDNLDTNNINRMPENFGFEEFNYPAENNFLGGEVELRNFNPDWDTSQAFTPATNIPRASIGGSTYETSAEVIGNEVVWTIKVSHGSYKFNRDITPTQGIAILSPNNNITEMYSSSKNSSVMNPVIVNWNGQNYFAKSFVNHAKTNFDGYMEDSTTFTIRTPIAPGETSKTLVFKAATFLLTSKNIINGTFFFPTEEITLTVNKVAPAKGSVVLKVNVSDNSQAPSEITASVSSEILTQNVSKEFDPGNYDVSLNLIPGYRLVLGESSTKNIEVRSKEEMIVEFNVEKVPQNGRLKVEVVSTDNSQLPTNIKAKVIDSNQVGREILTNTEVELLEGNYNVELLIPEGFVIDPIDTLSKTVEINSPDLTTVQFKLKKASGDKGFITLKVNSSSGLDPTLKILGKIDNTIDINRDVKTEIEVGTHSVELILPNGYELEQGETNPKTVNVLKDENTDVSFNIVKKTNAGSLLLNVSASDNSTLPNGIVAEIEKDGLKDTLENTVPKTVDSGTYKVTLNIPEGYELSQGDINPKTVEVRPGEETKVNFSIEKFTAGTGEVLISAKGTKEGNIINWEVILDVNTDLTNVKVSNEFIIADNAGLGPIKNVSLVKVEGGTTTPLDTPVGNSLIYKGEISPANNGRYVYKFSTDVLDSSKPQYSLAVNTKLSKGGIVLKDTSANAVVKAGDVIGSVEAKLIISGEISQDKTKVTWTGLSTKTVTGTYESKLSNHFRVPPSYEQELSIGSVKVYRKVPNPSNPEEMINEEVLNPIITMDDDGKGFIHTTPLTTNSEDIYEYVFDTPINQSYELNEIYRMNGTTNLFNNKDQLIDTVTNEGLVIVNVTPDPGSDKYVADNIAGNAKSTNGEITITGRYGSDGKTIIWTIITENNHGNALGDSVRTNFTTNDNSQRIKAITVGNYAGNASGTPVTSGVGSNSGNVTGMKISKKLIGGPNGKYEITVLTDILDFNQSEYTLTAESILTINSRNQNVGPVTAKLEGLVKDIKVEKQWQNAPSNYMPTINIELYKNGVKEAVEKTIISGGKEVVFKSGEDGDFRTFDEEGNRIIYTVKESPVPRYYTPDYIYKNEP